jgi:Leucine-rich repeat (LRR) protein
MIFFRSHKLILAARSPGLRKRLMETPDTLAIPDLTKEQVSQVLELVLKGRIEVPSNKCESFLETARNFGILLGLPKSGEEKSKCGEEKSKCGEEKSKSGGAKTKAVEEKPNNKQVESEPPKKKTKFERMRRCETSDIEEELSNGDEETNLNKVKSEPPKKKVELCGLESLPDEVLVKILSHISTHDLLQNVALVSKRFKALSEDHAAHNIVELDNNVRVKGAVRFLRKAISLQELHISYPAYNPINAESRLPKGLCGEILLAIADHSFVKVINVSDHCGSVSAADFETLSQTKLFRSLTKLVLPILKDAPEPDDEMSTAIASLTNAKNLRHLDLSNGTEKELPYRELLDVALACERIHTIKPIYMLDDNDLEQLVEARKSTLLQLELFVPFDSSDNTPFEVITQPLDVLSECTQLKKLKFMPFEDSINTLTSLKLLNEVEIWLPYEHEFEHSIAPNSLPQVSKLVLNVSDGNNNCLIALAKACPNLRELKIDFDFFEVSNLKALDICQRSVKEFVMSCHKLEVISSSCVSNNITSLIVDMDQVFDDACYYLPNLQILQLYSDYKLSIKRIKELVKSSQTNLQIRISKSKTLYVQADTTAQKIVEATVRLARLDNGSPYSPTPIDREIIKIF